MTEKQFYFCVPVGPVSDTGLSNGDFRVFTAICSFGNKEGIAFPSIPKIMERSTLSRSQVKRSIKVLIEKGYIEKEATGRRGKASIYKLEHLYRETKKHKKENA